MAKFPADFGAAGNGESDDRDALASLSAVVANASEALLPPGTFKIGSDVTIEGTWRFERGARFYLAAGVTLTINGIIDAGKYQIFEYENETCRIDFEFTDALQTLYPEWWGAKADNRAESASKNVIAFNRMFWCNLEDNNYGLNFHYQLSPRRYYTDDTLWVRKNAHLSGPGSIYNIDSQGRAAMRLGIGRWHTGYTRAEGPAHFYCTVPMFSQWMAGLWKITVFDQKGIGNAGTFAISEVINANEVVLEGASFVFEDQVYWDFGYSKIYRPVLENIFLSKMTYSRVGDGICLDAADWVRLKKLYLAGFEKGIRSGFVAHTQNFEDVEFIGCDVGYYCDNVRDYVAGPPNVSMWKGGKSQQNFYAVYHLVGMSGASFEGQDLSLNGGGQGEAYIWPLQSDQYVDGNAFTITRNLPTVGEVSIAFEMDDDDSVAAGSVAIDISGGVDAETMRNRIVAAIAAQSSLDLTVTYGEDRVILRDACTKHSSGYDAPIELSTSTIPAAVITVPPKEEIEGKEFRLNGMWRFIFTHTDYNDRLNLFRVNTLYLDKGDADQVRDELIATINNHTGRHGFTADRAGQRKINLYYTGTNLDGHYEDRLTFSQYSITASGFSFEHKTGFRSAWYGASLLFKNSGGIDIQLYTERVGGLWKRGTSVANYGNGRHKNKCANLSLEKCSGLHIHNTSLLSANGGQAPLSDETQWALHAKDSSHILLNMAGSVGPRDGYYFDSGCSGVVDLYSTSEHNLSATECLDICDETAGEVVSFSTGKYRFARSTSHVGVAQNFLRDPWDFSKSDYVGTDRWAARQTWFAYDYGAGRKPAIVTRIAGPDGSTQAQVLDWAGTASESNLTQVTDIISGLQDGTKKIILEFWAKLYSIPDQLDADVTGKPWPRINLYLRTGTQSPANRLINSVPFVVSQHEWHRYKYVVYVPADDVEDTYLELTLARLNGAFDHQSALGGFNLRFFNEAEEYIDSRIDGPIDVNVDCVPLSAPVGIIQGDKVARLMAADAHATNEGGLPTLGVAYGTGDFVINTRTEPENAGWVCTRSGVPGSWASVPAALQASYVLDFAAPSSVPGQVEKNLTLPGVRRGDKVVLSCEAGVPSNFVLSGTVSDTDQVTIVWTQFAGEASDPDGNGARYFVEAGRADRRLLNWEPSLCTPNGIFWPSTMLKARDCNATEWKDDYTADVFPRVRVVSASEALPDFNVETDFNYPLDLGVYRSAVTGTTGIHWRAPNNKILLPGANDFALEFFVYVAASYDSNHTVFGELADAQGWRWFINTSSQLTLYAYSTTPTVIALAQTSPLAEGWHHVMYFVDRDEDSTDGAILYVDGVEEHASANWMALSPKDVTLQPDEAVDIFGEDGKFVGGLAGIMFWQTSVMWPGGEDNRTLWNNIVSKRYSAVIRS